MDDQGLIYFFLLIESDRTKRKKTVHNDYEVGFMRLRLIATSPGTKPSTSPSPVVEPVSGLGWGFRLPSHRACTRTRAWLSTLDARAVSFRATFAVGAWDLKEGSVDYWMGRVYCVDTRYGAKYTL